MRPIQLIGQRDFRGGLNLRPDTFELAKDESPDLLNVDIDPRGGVEQRAGIRIRSNTIANPNQLTLDESTATGTGAFPLNSQGGTLLRDATRGPHIGSSWAFSPTGGVAALVSVSAIKAVVASQPYSAFAYSLQVTGAAVQWRMRLDWYTSVGGFISSSTGGAVTPPTGSTFLNLYIQATSPATAGFVLLVIESMSSPVAGTQVNFGGLQVANGYNFDGWLNPDTPRLPAEITSLTNYQREGWGHTLVALSNEILFWADHISQAWTAMRKWKDFHASQMKGDLYIVRDGIVGMRWTGVTTTLLGTAFNDNLAAPTNANMPIAKYVTSFQNCAFVACTTESSVRYPNRLRWSHPNQPADFRSFDFIEIDSGQGGDEITGLVPMEDRLLIFKRHSIYVLSGTSPDNFQVYPLSRSIGAISQRAIVNTDIGVYFFSWPDGVYLFNGKSLSWQFEKLAPLVHRGNIQPDKADLIRLGWSGRRLWVSVPYRAISSDTSINAISNTRVYILDPALSKSGSWTVYSIKVGPMFTVRTEGQPATLVGALALEPYLQELENPLAQRFGFDLDERAGGSVNQPITNSYYVTPWVDLGESAVRKRWRTPEIVFRKTSAVVAHQVSVRRDYTPETYRTMTLYTTESGGVNWSASAPSQVIKGRPLGSARAVQLRIQGPGTGLHWGVNAITLKFQPKKVRS